ncbi:ATP-binding protein [Nonomuraea longispora]|uniref:ATP-binding protein n=1 Tax=Nonomuraea longispora TaxID=1848320 RepID=A0A4R4NCM9_9ACTN|nr:ATP-binding protein [Nonomuraea longispora]TDC04857.1 ATP-binding protein [Nonomuraea longispora]
MRTLLTQRFTLDDVSTLRRSVACCAERSGLSGSRLEDFVLAVHESVVNAVEHAGGHGHLRLWTVDGVIHAETTDSGTGIPEEYLDRHHLPSDFAASGRGIFLIRELCDAAEFRTGPRGTTVRLTMRLGPRVRGAGEKIGFTASGRPGAGGSMW